MLRQPDLVQQNDATWMLGFVEMSTSTNVCFDLFVSVPLRNVISFNAAISACEKAGQAEADCCSTCGSG